MNYVKSLGDRVKSLGDHVKSLGDHVERLGVRIKFNKKRIEEGDEKSGDELGNRILVTPGSLIIKFLHLTDFAKILAKVIILKWMMRIMFHIFRYELILNGNRCVFLLDIFQI